MPTLPSVPSTVLLHGTGGPAQYNAQEETANSRTISVHIEMPRSTNQNGRTSNTQCTSKYWQGGEHLKHKHFWKEHKVKQLLWNTFGNFL